jgi:hypothetical protein
VRRNRKFAQEKGDTVQVGSAEKGTFRENVVIYGFLGLFAITLALITSRHEMYLDEVQPWLFVRNAHSLLPVIKHLRYEAHPALWFISLFLASRIWSSVIMMQCVNFVFAVLTAWVILSARSLPIVVRVLIVFGVSVFFTTGVIARDYMLGAFLLTSATRCLLAKPSRHWRGIVFLGLAMNSHFLALPVAACIFVWLYWLEPGINWQTALAKLREAKFWFSTAFLLGALVACYLTVRPAEDIATHLDVPGGNTYAYLVLAVGRMWHYYLPLSASTSKSVQNSALALPAYTDVLD